MDSQHEQELLEQFVIEQKGKIVCVTDDVPLIRIVRYAVAPFTEEPDEVVHVKHDPEQATRLLTRLADEGCPAIVILERRIDGKKTTDIVKRFMRLFPTACLLVTGSDITRESAAYLFELGISGYLTKPLSTNTVISKMVRCLDSSREEHLTRYIRELTARSENEEALEAIDKFLAINPDSSQAHCLRGDALLLEGDLSEAIKAYEHAWQLNKTFVEPLKRLAAVYKGIDDDKTLAALTKMERISPFNPERKIEKGEVHLRRGDKDKARTAFDAGYEQASKEYSLLLSDYAEQIADATSSKMPEMSEHYLAKAIETKQVFTPLDLHMFNRLGMAYRERGEWEKAVALYKKALTVAPKDPALFYNMALAYHTGGKEDEVMRCLRRALELQPDFNQGNEGVSYNIGVLYMDFDEFEAAIPFFEQVLEINPDNGKAAKKLKLCRNKAD